MVKTFTNLEIDKYITVISDKNSFRNNTDLKIPGSLDWALRINLKKLNEIYTMYMEARTELGRKYVAAGKVEGENVKPEYIKEYNADLWELMTQKNEVNIRPIKIRDFIDLPLSMPEKDFLLCMCEDDDVEKYFNENE